MHRIMNGIKQQASDLDHGRATVRYGIIDGVDPNRHLVRVLIQPENVLSGWLEIATSVPGWQMTPPLGTQAVILPREGDSQNGIVVGYTYSNPDPPPSPANAPGTGGTPNTAHVPAGSNETIFTNKGGAVIRMNADGSIYMRGTTVGIDGDLHVNGDVFDKIGKLDALRQHYNAHTHGGVQSGGGNTGPTNQVDP